MQHVSSRNVTKPPEKGVFPLDHFEECKQIATQYLKCLKEYDRDAMPCREVAKVYLQCRMDRNLMARQDLKDLGFKEDEVAAVAATAAAAAAAAVTATEPTPAQSASGRAGSPPPSLSPG